MNIRKIYREDIKALSELYVSVFSKAPWNETWESSWADERLSEIFASPGFIGYLCKYENNLVGAILGRSLSFKGRREFEILEFFVNTKNQNSGSGSKLLSTLEAELTSKAYKYTTLLTARNSDAERFYNNRGYNSSTKMVFMSHEL